LQGIKICAILANFCPNSVAMAAPPTLLKIQVARTLEFTQPMKPTKNAKNSSISCKKRKFVQFWLIFFWIWLPWQLPWFPWKLR